MPSFPIIDSHVHLWDPGRYRIPWLDALPSIGKPMGLHEYDVATDGIDVEGLVYLQVEVAPPYALLEARDLVVLAREEPLIKGIVPWAPLEFGEQARYFLEELVALGPEIKAVRRIVQDEPDPAFCLQPGFVRGNQILGELGLASDICCNFRQLAQNIELVRRCPETGFILDHIAKPNIRGGELEPWASQMRELASLPNVTCKISGVATEADHANWTVGDIEPYVRLALDAFGEDRVMFGSDWPVATLATDYARWVKTLEELTQDLSETARRKLWSENAKRVYRLG
ncbi:MAG: amidohydrolase family protein [Thermomicrobiales bacterium]|nr:amidohydrolase family protein [Thermomicrobiales bacterium]